MIGLSGTLYGILELKRFFLAFEASSSCRRFFFFFTSFSSSAITTDLISEAYFWKVFSCSRSADISRNCCFSASFEISKLWSFGLSPSQFGGL